MISCHFLTTLRVSRFISRFLIEKKFLYDHIPRIYVASHHSAFGYFLNLFNAQ